MFSAVIGIVHFTYDGIVITPFTIRLVGELNNPYHCGKTCYFRLKYYVLTIVLVK